MDDLLTKLRDEFYSKAFSIGLLVGIFISSYAYSKSNYRSKKYMVDALENAKLNVNVRVIEPLNYTTKE